MTSTADIAAGTRQKISIRMPSRATRRRYGLFALLVAPALLLRFGTAIYPIVQTILYSFRDLSLLRGTDEFIGFQNYANLTTNFGVRSALSFTLMYVIASTVLELIVGLLIAQLLNSNFKGRTFARTINLIPWAMPTIVAGYVFRWLLDEQFGLIPYWVSQFTGEQMVVFIDPSAARIAVILAHVWKDAPFMAVVFLAGMQGIPLDLYEAAKVDGANAWQRFWRITLPLVAPLVITMGLFRVVWSLATFDLVLGLTAGGPGVATSVLALQIFREGILFFKFGFASAISVLLLVLVALIGALGMWLYRRVDVSY